MINFTVVEGDYLVSFGTAPSEFDLPVLTVNQTIILNEVHRPTPDAKSGERWNIKTKRWEDVRSAKEKEDAKEFEVHSARYAEYPPLADFADAMYWQSKGDNSKMAAYLSRVDAVKTKFPKPVK